MNAQSGFSRLYISATQSSGDINPNILRKYLAGRIWLIVELDYDLRAGRFPHPRCRCKHERLYGRYTALTLAEWILFHLTWLFNPYPHILSQIETLRPFTPHFFLIYFNTGRMSLRKQFI